MFPNKDHVFDKLGTQGVRHLRVHRYALVFHLEKKMCFLSVDNFLRSRLLPTGALGVVFGFLLLRFARIRFRLPFLSGKERHQKVSAREIDYAHYSAAFRRKEKEKSNLTCETKIKTSPPPSKKYARFYLVGLLELFLLRVGELVFLCGLFVDGHFY